MRRKQKKKLLSSNNLMSLFMIIIMVGGVSIFIVQNMDPAGGETYKDYRFSFKNGKYVTKINDKQISFDYPPSSLEGIPVDDSVKTRLSNSPMMYVTYDPESRFKQSMSLAQYELENTLFEGNMVYVQKGLTTAFEGTALQIITCVNATPSVPVVLFEKGNETKLTLENNCIIGSGQSTSDFLVLKDLIAYHVFKVME